MIENLNGKIYINNKKLPKGDVDILKILLKHGPCTAFEIMEKRGHIFVQYTQTRLRVLSSHLLGNIVIKTDDGFEINPELKEELGEALE